MTLTLSYEDKRDLLTGMVYKRSNTQVASRSYTYTPYGSVTMSGDLVQPIQWSSEYHDTELALVYYNYRHYNPTDGRWLGRDMVETNRWQYYIANRNNSISLYDYLGLRAKYVEVNPIEVKGYLDEGVDELNPAVCGLTGVYIKLVMNIKNCDNGIDVCCVKKIDKWSVIIHVQSRDAYQSTGLMGSPYVTDNEKKNDIMKLLQKMPRGLNKAKYLAETEFNNGAIKPEVSTYEGNLYHEKVHKKQLLKYKKKWQKLMDSYEEIVECSGERRTPEEVRKSCRFSYEQDWIYSQEVGIDMPDLDHAKMEKEALMKTYEYYLNKYDIR
ncbi:MAG: hypothetical protein IJB33_04835 [Akkermansia sp.]|nr:hypothetical protein [Akkermansia sp.]